VASLVLNTLYPLCIVRHRRITCRGLWGRFRRRHKEGHSQVCYQAKYAEEGKHNETYPNKRRVNGEILRDTAGHTKQLSIPALDQTPYHAGTPL